MNVRTIFLALALFTMACDSQEAQEIAQLKPDLANGAQIYSAQCASCHGTDGKGGSFDVDLIEELHHSDATLIDVILNGSQEMPSYRDDYDDQEIADVMGHIRVTLGTD